MRRLRIPATRTAIPAPDSLGKFIEDMTMRWPIRWVLILLLLPGVTLAATDALIKWPNFDGLADKATESVSITFDEPLLRMATRFLSSDEPESAEAIKVLQGLRGIYVRSYTFRESFVYPRDAIETLRKQLTAPAWSQLMEVRSSKEQANVGIYISLDGASKANGLVIISTEPHEFTIVNIVGAIDLDQLKNIEGKLGIPKLKLDAKKTETKPTKK